MKSKELKTLFLSLAATVLLTGCGSDSKHATKASPTVAVRTMKVATGGQTAEKNYVGTVEEEDGVNVSFSTIGTIVRVMADEGQFVKKGQALAELDGVTIRNAYKMSKATLEQAEDAYRRLKNLYDKGTLPEIKMVEMETQLQKARSAEAISHKSLDDIVLRAPWSGYIASSTMHVGANVVPGATGFRLVKIDRVKVNVPIPEREIGAVTIGQPLHFNVTALGDRQFTGRIVSRSLTSNPISHAYAVRALVENADHALLPGMVANVRMSSRGSDHLITIPQQAVLISGHDKFVWLVKAGVAERRSVVTGDITNAGVIVESGLSEGETVILEGQEKVSEGMKVKSVE